MALLKKNIWLLFYVLMLFLLILFSTLSYLSWNTTYKDYQTTQEHMINLIADSTRSLFKTQETILNIVGNRFLEDPTFKDNPNAIKTLNATLLDNPSMEAIALVRPDGYMTFVTGGYDVSKFPNLLKQETSRDSFLATLKSDKMVFGRTYYFDAIEQWITPIRKAIRDDNGTIVTIITAALRVQDSFGTFGMRKDIDHQHTITILRDEDFYFQYLSNNTTDNFETYLVPMSNSIKEMITRSIWETHRITIEQLKASEHTISFLHTDTNFAKLYLLSLHYDSTYKLWFGVRIPLSIIIKDFLRKFAIYVLIFTLISTIFFLLFRIIVKADAKRNADLIFQATHDQLTNLSNRMYLQDHIDRWIYNEAPAFSILYVDLDHFKNINDSFGHQVGDLLLIELAKRLRKIILDQGKIIRHGGDEFVIFIALSDEIALLNLAHTIIETISNPYIINKITLNIGASIGIAKYPDHGLTLDMLLRAADIAMYESKKIKNSVHIFADTMQEGYLKNVRIEQELRNALEQNELFMVYQPQMDNAGNIYGVEALVRWNSSLLGIIPPDQFIPIAEMSAQMTKIGRFIITQTLQEVKEVQDRLDGTPFQTSINISVRQLMETGFLEHFLEVIHTINIDHISITIEITENLMIEDIEYIIPLLQDLRNVGIQVSMDDFGTGYSSLSMLRKLPIDELKIDKSFIDTLVEDKSAQRMVQNIIAIGKNLNMSVVAEGVETARQKKILASFGCDRFQGYYFAQPLRKDDLIAFFQNHRAVQILDFYI